MNTNAMAQIGTQKDFQACAAQTIEGEVIFGIINMGAFLCQDTAQAQGIVQSLDLEISAQELLARHAALRDSGIDLSYSCNLITPYREVVTLYITQETYEQIWAQRGYNTVEQRHHTKYVTATAYKVIPGIWVAEGEVAIKIQAGWPRRCHMHHAVLVSPEERYHEEFLVQLRNALDDINAHNIHMVPARGESLSSRSAQKTSEKQDSACVPFTTRTFDNDMHMLPVEIQENIWKKVRALLPEPTRGSSGVKGVSGFMEIFRVTVMNAYWVLYVLSTEKEVKHLYLLRTCPVEGILKIATEKR